MSAILTIDKGNTATKLKVFSDSEELLFACVCGEPDIDRIAALVAEYNVGCGAFCSVGHIDTRIVETLRRMLPGGFMLLTADTDVPVKVSYGTPRTLGADRVAAACGAVSLWPGTPLLVADAGTALTLDFIDASGRFLGGDISAGIAMRLKSLHSYTSALPEAEASGPLPPFGTDTATALRCGAVRGVVAEIEAALSMARTRMPGARLILTGGDAPLLSPLLPDETICHSELVSVGLISILKYNEYI